MIERHAWLDPSRAPLYVVTYPATRALDDVKNAHEAIESYAEAELWLQGRLAEALRDAARP